MSRSASRDPARAEVLVAGAEDPRRREAAAAVVGKHVDLFLLLADERDDVEIAVAIDVGDLAVDAAPTAPAAGGSRTTTRPAARATSSRPGRSRSRPPRDRDRRRRRDRRRATSATRATWSTMTCGANALPPCSRVRSPRRYARCLETARRGWPRARRDPGRDRDRRRLMCAGPGISARVCSVNCPAGDCRIQVTRLAAASATRMSASPSRSRSAICDVGDERAIVGRDRRAQRATLEKVDARAARDGAARRERRAANRTARARRRRL